MLSAAELIGSTPPVTILESNKVRALDKKFGLSVSVESVTDALLSDGFLICREPSWKLTFCPATIANSEVKLPDTETVDSEKTRPKSSPQTTFPRPTNT